MSSTITVRNGTAVGRESLCRSCCHAHIQTGFAGKEEEVRCGYYYKQPRLVPFAVSKCTDFAAKLTPSLYELQKIALVIDVAQKNSSIGFIGAAFKIVEEEEKND
jgi:hypothetical protein